MVPAALKSTWKQKTFTQLLQNMLKRDLILQIMDLIDHYLKEKTKALLDKLKMNYVEK